MEINWFIVSIVFIGAVVLIIHANKAKLER